MFPLLLLTTLAVAPQPAPTPAEWTVLIYMNGDNNLEPYALKDFKELAAVGSTRLVNVVVQLDRIGKYQFTYPDNWSEAVRFRVEKGMQPTPSAGTPIGEVNMGDPAVLREFVSWGISTYPAKKYALIIWDHGQGWRSVEVPPKDLAVARGQSSRADIGLPLAASAPFTLVAGADFRSSLVSPYRSASNDETSSDELFNSETTAALTQALDGKKLDVLGFDACLMAMIETAYAMRGVARVLVASEELEPGDGWAYHEWLGALVKAPQKDAVGLSRLLVESYKSYYGSGLQQDDTTTLSAINLELALPVAQAVSALAEGILGSFDTEFQPTMWARYDLKVFGQPSRNPFHHVDLRELVKGIKTLSKSVSIQELCTRVITAIDAAIISSYAGAARQTGYGTSGLAIYFPSSASDYQSDVWAAGGYDPKNTVFPVPFVVDFKWSVLMRRLFVRAP